MRTLEALWLSLEEMMYQFCQLCINHPTTIPPFAIKGFLLELESRHTKREQWDERRADKIYQHRIQEPHRPVARPLFDESTTNTMGKNLEPAIQKLKELHEKLLRCPEKSSKNVDERNDTKSTKGKGQNPVTKILLTFEKKFNNDSTKGGTSKTQHNKKQSFAGCDAKFRC